MLGDNWQTAYSAVKVLLLIDILVGFTQVYSSVYMYGCSDMCECMCVYVCMCVILTDDLQWEL